MNELMYDFDYIKSFISGKKGVEIYCMEIETTIKVAEISELYLIDEFRRIQEEATNKIKNEMKNSKIMLLENFPFQAVKIFNHRELDFAIINNVKDYEEIEYLTKLIYPKLKIGGYLIMNHKNHIENQPITQTFLKGYFFRNNTIVCKKISDIYG